MTKKYRPGAIGALLDIYEEVLTGLKKTIEDIPDQALTVITDAQTTDDNCRSIQTILSHVVHSGFGYTTSIDNLKGTGRIRPEKTFHKTIGEYMEDLDKVFTYTENVFSKIRDNELEQLDEALKIKSSWGQTFDIEQLTEHAIVHILRHTRQIKKIKQNISN